MKWAVSARDDSFTVYEEFTNYDDAAAYADEMCEVFGSWNTEIYSINGDTIKSI